MRRHAAIFASLLTAAAACAQPANQPAKPADQPAVKPAEQPKAAVPAANRTESGRGLVIPDDQKKLGTTYFTVASGGKQVSFTSQALNAKFDGHSNSVIGYAIANPSDPAALLKAGTWALPVKSLDSGSKLRDKHISGKDWLDSSICPDIIFVLKSVQDAKLHKESPAGKSFTATIVGDMTIHGITRELTIPDAILGFAAASDKSPVKGDLLAIRCKYKVKLTDYGVNSEYITTLKSVADDIEIDQTLMLSTVPPEQQPAPKPEEEAK